MSLLFFFTGVTFDYSDPSKWKTNFEICGYSSQSPISLPPIVDMDYDSNLGAFSLTNFDKPVSMYNLTIKNTGGSGMIELHCLNAIYIIKDTKVIELY